MKIWIKWKTSDRKSVTDYTMGVRVTDTDRE